MNNKHVIYSDEGTIRYKKAWDLQEALLKKSADLKLAIRRKEVEEQPVPNYLLFCEHPPVYTLGKSGNIENLLLNERELEERGIDFFHNNRGGDITYHGPGQIVGYPIIDLENFKPDLHEYLRNLEEACILTLKDYGIVGERIEGLTGVWVDAQGTDPRKVMAIGVRCVRWITMHGFAFNINTDLSYFKHIIPCGIDDKGVTSVAVECGREINMDEAKLRMRTHLAELFGFSFES